MNDISADWIGHTRKATETITDRQVREFRVTLDGVLDDGAPLAGLHWCLTPEVYPPADLGRDAHPKLGLFLPDLGLPRRMWAGGRLSYKGEVTAGDTVTRETRIRDIKFKEGRTGKLGFVTLDHDYTVAGDLRVSEEHNIVYRDDPSPDAPGPVPPQAEPWTPLKRIDVLPNPTLLFRYSAMTFNGHRIHYDPAYATSIEGYAGLVVHGPLQSTWMQIMATALLGHLPTEFSYRGLSPLTCNRPATIEAIAADQGLSLRVRDLDANVVTMAASAR